MISARGYPPRPNRQPPTANRQPPTANRQPPTTNRQPPTANRQPPTTNHQPPTANRRPLPPSPPLDATPPRLPASPVSGVDSAPVLADLTRQALVLSSKDRYALHPIEAALQYHRAEAHLPDEEGDSGLCFAEAEAHYRAGAQGLRLPEIPQLAQHLFVSTPDGTATAFRELSDKVTEKRRK